MTAFTVPDSNNNNDEGWEIIEEAEPTAEVDDDEEIAQTSDDDEIWETEENLKSLSNRDVKLLMQFMEDYTY